MNRARSFFYVCAGICLLSLAFHLGARSAKAQTGALDAAEITEFYGAIPGVVISRMMYEGHGGGGGPLTVILSDPRPIPGSAPVVALNAVEHTVLLANGDYYELQHDGWILTGNMLGSPTSVTKSTWGQLKARYLQGATPQSK
jgi:hypothetical protein